MKTIGILTTSVANTARPSKVKTIGVEMAYYEYFQQFGNVRIVTPDQKPEDMQLDLLVLPGGPDFSTALQGFEFAFETNEEVIYLRKKTGDDIIFQVGQNGDQPLYTYFYMNRLADWINAGVPIFGICMGFQALASLFGAKLIANMYGHQIADNGKHVVIGPSELPQLTKGVEVNSRHHQAISLESFPSSLKVVAKCGRHVEAMSHEVLPIAAVQWHPEDMLHDNYMRGDVISDKLIESLLEYAPEVTEQGVYS